MSAKVVVLYICLVLFGSTHAQMCHAASHTIKKKEAKKLKCTLYGNCQMKVVYDYLTKKHPERYECTLVINYKTIFDSNLLPLQQLQQADIFIFQPLHGHGRIDTDYIRANYLKSSCRCISFPYIFFSGYFPDYVDDRNNIRTISDKCPFGIYGYGHQKIIDFIALGLAPHHILELSERDDLFSPGELYGNLERTLEILREKEKETDVKLSDFIKKNFRKYRLFHTVKHPTNVLLKELFKQLLPLLGLRSKNIDSDPFFSREHLTFETTDIIYPSVAKILNLHFTASHALRGYEEVSCTEYINGYMKLLYPDYYKNWSMAFH